MFQRLGRWCFNHRLTVLAAWLVIAIVGAVASGTVFASLEQERNLSTESAEGADKLEQANSDHGSVIALISGVDPANPQTRSVISTAAADAGQIKGISRVDEPFNPSRPSSALIAKKGNALIVVGNFADDLSDEAKDTVIADFTKRLDRVEQDLATSKVEIGGSQVLANEINEKVSTDLGKAELISLPLSLLVMVVIFAGFFAAGVPVIGAIMAILAAMISLFGFSKLGYLDPTTVTIVTLLGLGLSIDYGLLLLSRYRDELRTSNDRQYAIGRATATAGRTIAFSALTVAAALGTLIVVDMPAMKAVGAAGVSIALVTMVVALTLVPALIRLFGKRIKPSRKPSSAEGKLFSRIAVGVQRQPKFTVLVVLVILGVLASPLLSTKFINPGLAEIPSSVESKRVFTALEEQFDRPEQPAITVIAQLDVVDLDTWAAQHTTDEGVKKVHPARAIDQGLSVVDIDVRGNPYAGSARDTVAELRADRPSTQSWVTGESAFFYDDLAILKRDLPTALGVMAVVMIVLLFLMTGSVIIPLKAIIANVLSFGATLGVMTAIFQWGWLSSPLDLITLAGLSPLTIVIMFAFAFGLSMDYEVFLLGRIKELRDAGHSTNEAIRLGLQRTGRVITSAALLMIIVFAAFGASEIGTMEQTGVVLVTAVLLDATIVRCLLVPAAMTLLGKWNWWAPKPLAKLHALFGLREAPNEPAHAPKSRNLTYTR